jgi:hypothetical protein
MANVKELYVEAKDLLYNFSKVKLITWLEVKENVFLFENFISLLKDNMIETYGNISQFTSEKSIKKSMSYFKH